MSEPSTTPTGAEPASSPSILGGDPSNPNPSPSPAPSPAEGQRPEYIPEKFWDKEKNTADVGKLGAAYISLEKMASQKALKHPGDTAPPEQITEFYKQLGKITGAPEDIKGYGLQKPDNLPEGMEWNQEHADGAATIALKYGIPPAAMREFTEHHNKFIEGMLVKGAESHEQQIAAVKAGLEKEWGAEFGNNIERAKRGAAGLGVDFKVSPHLANDPAFIKAALNFDKMLREDKGLVHGESENATYQERIDKILKSDDYHNKNGPEAQQRAAAQYRQLYDAMNAKK